MQYALPETEIEIKQPSPKPQKPKKNLILSLIPSIVMLVLMVVLRGMMGGGGMFVIYSVCSMGIGIVMSVITYRVDGKDHKKALENANKNIANIFTARKRTLVRFVAMSCVFATLFTSLS